MYYGTLLIIMVMAVPTLSRSSTMHNLQEIYPAKRAPPQDCNPSPGALHDSLMSKESPATSLDDTGVYFVPSDVISFQTQFTDLSFLISNPINFITNAKIRRAKKEFKSKEDFHDETSEQVKTHNDKQDEDKQAYGKIIVKSPIYLDLDFQAADNFERSSLQENIFVEDFEKTEQALNECLDLHVLDYMRRYGTVEEFKEFRISSIIKKYDNLTDLDLNDRMRKYCSNPESIVKQSFRNIKSGALNWKLDNLSDLKNKESKSKIIHDANERIISTISTSPSNLEILPTDLPSMIGKSTENPFVTTEYDDDDTYTTRTTLNNTEVRASSGFVVTTENNIQFYDPDNISNMSKIAQENILKYNNFDMDTLAAEVGLAAENYNKITLDKDNNEQNHNKNTSVAPTLQTVKDDFLLKFSLDESDVLTDDTLTTPILPPEIRDKLQQNETKIPKLITKECKNNTVKSVIDGIEVLPNNDFTNLQTAQDKSPVNDSLPDNEQLTENTSDHDPIFYDSEYITGNIYFGTSKELVPIRFQQTDNGKINLSIDGNSLCDKLFRMTTKRSLLLTTLCELHQNMPRKNSIVEH